MFQQEVRMIWLPEYKSIDFYTSLGYNYASTALAKRSPEACDHRGLDILYINATYLYAFKTGAANVWLSDNHIEFSLFIQNCCDLSFGLFLLLVTSLKFIDQQVNITSSQPPSILGFGPLWSLQILTVPLGFEAFSSFFQLMFMSAQWKTNEIDHFGEEKESSSQ